MKKLLLPLIAGFLPASLSAQLIINEFLADPPPGDIAGDANGDGVRGGTTDEFIELVNTSGASVDVENWTISDLTGLRHTFVGSTLVADGQALVVFGGGVPVGDFGGAIVATASEGTLSFNNGGDTITIQDELGNVVVTHTYGGEGGNDTALTLDPDLTGVNFVDHNALGDGSLAFSPGTRSSGAPFAGDALSVMVSPSAFSEGAGAAAASGTVTRTGDVGSALTVTLSSGDVSELTVPGSVQILAGQASATFAVDAVDDADQDANQSVLISAVAAGLFSGSFSVEVEDDEAPIPTITLVADPGSFSENGGASTVTIEVSVADAAGYAFELSSSDTSELTVPAMVLIPAMATTASFELTGVDDADSDGTQNVTVTARDPNEVILAAEVVASVTDDEVFTAPDIVINELRTDNEGGDNVGVDVNEYVEIFGATANYSLDRVWLLVLGDSGAANRFGNVDRAYDLNGRTGNGNYFLIGGDSMTDPVADLPSGTNLLENGDSLTFLLVTDFTGSTGDDLDVDDDGVLDSMPWGSVIDAVSSLQSEEAIDGLGLGYATALGGTDVMQAGPFPAAHLFRSPSGTGPWQIGPFEDSIGDPDVDPPVLATMTVDTPGAENSDSVNQPVEDEIELVDFFLDQGGANAVIVARGLGAKIWKIQVSDDLSEIDTWADLSVGFTETDNPDGTTSFSFSAVVSDVKKFYRLIEE